MTTSAIQVRDIAWNHYLELLINEIPMIQMLGRLDFIEPLAQFEYITHVIILNQVCSPVQLWRGTDHEPIWRQRCRYTYCFCVLLVQITWLLNGISG